MQTEHENRKRIEKLAYLRSTGKISDKEFFRYVTGEERTVKPVKTPVAERIVTPDMLRPIQMQYIVTVHDAIRRTLCEIDSLLDYNASRVTEMKTGYFKQTLGHSLKWAHILNRDNLCVHDIKITCVDAISTDNKVLKLTFEWQVEKTMPEAEFISGMDKWLTENKTMYDVDHMLVDEIKLIT